jgi:hypothetical protein
MPRPASSADAGSGTDVGPESSGLDPTPSDSNRRTKCEALGWSSARFELTEISSAPRPRGTPANTGNSLDRSERKLKSPLKRLGATAASSARELEKPADESSFGSDNRIESAGAERAVRKTATATTVSARNFFSMGPLPQLPYRIRPSPRIGRIAYGDQEFAVDASSVLELLGRLGRSVR